MAKNADSFGDGLLLGMGNPLLDISTRVDDEFLKKYDLLPDNAILAEEKHKDILEDMHQFEEIEYTPGGATQNTLRTVQWFVRKPFTTVFFGCINQDKHSEIMQRSIKSAGVRAIYQINSSNAEPTGTCAVCITGDNRSLVANLGSANCFTKKHLDDPRNWKLVEDAKFYYSAGFFLTVSVESVLEVAQHACDNNKPFMTNLSAPFICQFFKENQMKVMPYVDILFGNESEAEAFSAAQDFDTKDIKEIALKAAALPKVNKKRDRIVVFTQGADPTVVVTGGKAVEYPVIKVRKEDLVDTNGAGDAFVGGFLSQYIQGASIERCIEAANYVANLIIQRHGCTFPEVNSFK